MITLKTLAKATKQEVFDQVARHLLTQGKRAESKEGYCKFRWYGKKCAAGCLISDGEYKRKFDAEGVFGWGGLVDNGFAPKTHRYFITQLQTVHDSDYPKEWMESLKDLARNSNVNQKVLKEFA